MDSQFRFYSLFFFFFLICKEDLISSLLNTHKVGVTMGTAQRSSVLRRAEACSIVPRDNSCLYLWQANRLIKGRPCLFLCPIPSPEQTLPYLRSAALAASTFPSLLWSEALARRESRHSVTERRRCSKNACLIVKLSQSPS